MIDSAYFIIVGFWKRLLHKGSLFIFFGKEEADF
jgi:hypothetical protein